jgi:hypothetical protein
MPVFHRGGFGNENYGNETDDSGTGPAIGLRKLTG